MTREEQVSSYLAEGICKSLLEDYQGYKTSPLIIDKQGKKLDVEGLNEFLKEYPKKDTLMKLLKDLNSNKLLLPDFICMASKNEVFFTEVKNRKNLTKFSQLDTKQKKAIKELAKNGYGVLVTNIKILSEQNHSQEVVDYNLKEQGKSLRGEELKMVYVKVKIFDVVIHETSIDNVAIQTIRIHYLDK